MEDKNYDQWLKDLKVYDTVIVETSYISKSLSVSKVVKITPKGGIRVEGHESRLFKDGYVDIIGDHTSYQLLQPTEARMDEILLVRLRGKLRWTDWGLIDDDVVKSVWQLIR